MSRPDFFIVGAPRCGTTSLYTYLNAHPEIYMPRYYKEPHYFGSDFVCPRFEKFRRSEEHYLALFEDAKTEQRVGEASVFYLYSRNAAQEIKDFNPNARIIIMLRSPIEMLFSYHNFLLYLGDEVLPGLRQALEAEPARKQGKSLPPRLYLMPEALYYSEIIKFSEQLKRYLEVFGSEQVHVILFDDLAKAAHEVYTNVLEFLCVAPDFRPDSFEKINPYRETRSKLMMRLVRSRWASRIGGYFPQIAAPISRWLRRLNDKPAQRQPPDPDLHLELKKRFKQEVQMLESLLQRDLTDWYSE